MTDDLLKSIHEELVAIRQLLAAQANAASPGRSSPARAASPSGYTGGSSGGGSGGGEEIIPQPSEVVPNAGDVQVHFGKNNGVALSKLSERSLSWYAAEQPPRLDSSGKPYPPRPQETTLKNAARTLWHQNKGTLGQAAPTKSAAGAELPGVASESSAHLSDEESVPF